MRYGLAAHIIMSAVVALAVGLAYRSLPLAAAGFALAFALLYVIGRIIDRARG